MQRWQRMLGIGWDGDWWSAVVISKSSSQKHEALNPCHLLCCKSKWQQVHRRQQQGNFQKGNGVAGGDHRQLRSRYSSWLTSLQFWSSSRRFAVSPGIWCVVRGETGGALSRVDDNILRRCSGKKKNAPTAKLHIFNIYSVSIKCITWPKPSNNDFSYKLGSTK